jgi:hypothetical protein
MWRNHFSQLLNVHGVNVDVLTVEPLVPEPSAFEFELAFEEQKSHKSPGIDQIPAELIKAGGPTIRYEIHKHVISICNKEKLPEDWKESVIVTIYMKGAKTDCSNYGGISFCQLRTKFIEHFALKVNSVFRGNYWG